MAAAWVSFLAGHSARYWSDTGHHAIDSGRKMSSDETADVLPGDFQMLGKLSKADGRGPRRMSRRAPDGSEFSKLSAEVINSVIEILNQAKNSNDQFRDYAFQFYEESHSKEALFQLIDLLLALVNADGVMHPRRRIEEVVTIFIFGENILS